ncbi:hypothetical protein BN140_1909 [Methanoculleus bourgensis MS2]|jgi:hypothetical protein|uniref:Glycerophosphoryl diester phosphodiesterase membrane domain-containing protein n=1 Tax=Methanoculleus bourgensis (strain ATCC 43281 / DSM 3045 / OCM 15 / MS2) TaxID=1201294 RepID=I7LKB9_METBM|nr:hypothetical protein [Methanoculleus bourgensis]CCJ36832.1 hypothetical protein BN140_1909 [Methanoculleus bourgensis MS2]
MAEETYAFSRLEGAFHRTKSLLWPVRWGVWLRLAVIALFVGGGISMPNIFQYQFDGSDFAAGTAGPFSGVAPMVVLGIIAVVLVIALLWTLIGATMQFVFVDMLSTGDIHIRRFFRERLGKGARLFLFELALIAVMILAIAAFVFMLIGVEGAGAATSLLIIALIPVILVAALLFGLVFLLTTDFVVPIMIREDCGIIAGWRRLIGMIASRFWQTVIYVIVRFVLGLVAAIAQVILVILALVVIAIPFILVGIVLLAALQENIVLLLALVIPYLIIAIPVALLIAVPFITFFRYYALLVLEGLLPEYRFLPE